MIRVIENCDESYMEWQDILAQTEFVAFNRRVYATYTPVGADRLIINDDGTCTLKVVDLRVLIDNLRNGGVSLDFTNIKVEPAYYLYDIQGYNSIILYKGWFSRVDSCGGAIICSEQEAYDRGLLAR